MPWKKIDDELTNPSKERSYSSFLANGLTKNANSYPQVLTRGGGIAWNAHQPVTWSSYHRPQGVMFTIDVGQNVLQVDFRIRYATLTGSTDPDGYQGKAFITHLVGGEFVEVGVLPTSGADSYFDVSMPLLAPATGPQSFSLTFRSSQLASLGLVDVQGGANNVIYLDQRGGMGHYNITTGEKHELLSLSEPGHTVDAVGGATEQFQYYQINYVEATAAPHPPDGYATVYPSLTANPPRLNPTYNSTKHGAGTVFELGAFTLLSVAFNAVAANENNAPAQLAHANAVSLAQVIRLQNRGRREFIPDLANCASSPFAFGAVIAGETFSPTTNAAQRVSFTFTVNQDIESELCVTFSAFNLYPSSFSELNLEVLDSAGTTLHSMDQTIYSNAERSQQAVAGITARGWYSETAAAKWGMRDSMPDGEMLEGIPQTFIVPKLANPWYAGNTYTIIISSNNNYTDWYVYNLYARFVTTEAD